jgi:hypothetical protein
VNVRTAHWLDVQVAFPRHGPDCECPLAVTNDGEILRRVAGPSDPCGPVAQ